MLVVRKFTVGPAFPIGTFTTEEMGVSYGSPSRPTEVPSSFGVTGTERPMIPIHSVVLGRLGIATLDFSSLRALLVTQ